MISRREAKRLAGLTTRYMQATGELLARCNSVMAPDEWARLGQTLGHLYSVLGDELLYPIGDSYPDLIEAHDLPARPGLTRRWGPRCLAMRSERASSSGAVQPVPTRTKRARKRA
ncbi:MAG: hypothetical protein JWP97_2655 [Labilithrix sp.]|nr:hypothetical protein [Labilithrix sp.]